VTLTGTLTVTLTLTLTLTRTLTLTLTGTLTLTLTGTLTLTLTGTLTLTRTPAQLFHRRQRRSMPMRTTAPRSKSPGVVLPAQTALFSNLRSGREDLPRSSFPPKV